MASVPTFLIFATTLLFPVIIITFVGIRVFPKSRSIRTAFVASMLLIALVTVPYLLLLWPIALLVWPTVVVLIELFVTQSRK